MKLDLTSLRQAYAAGRDPVAVIEHVYAAIAAAEDPGIFISLLPIAEARAMARALGAFDPAKPLWGVPFAVKDNIDVAGLPTTAACPAFAYKPPRHAFAVEALVAAGAIPIGKTNLDQFATGLTGLRTPYPAPRNPFDSAIVPGGSSSGSAVAVARGLVAFALGTDTAGSGRVPAALNNVVGLKPSPGAISIRGLVPACLSLDCVSIFAATVGDAWAIYELCAVPDNKDAWQRPLAIGRAGPVPPALRIGIPRAADLDFFGDAAAAEAWNAATALLRGFGWQLSDIDMNPLFATADMLYDGPWIAERHAPLAGFLASHAADVLPVTRSIIEKATRFSASDAFTAQHRRAELAHSVARLWTSIDALAVPSIPCAPTLAEVAADPYGPNARLGRWTNFVNLLDLCALAVPGPFRTDKLPAGVTLIGRRGTDAALASIGRVLHAKAGVSIGCTGEPLPRDDPPAAEADMIELVVVGAHLSGMALNGELQAAGARFRRAIATEPCYRFYALAGGPPHRPGLLRCAAGEGAPIATEVWALPPAAFARFVAAIPAPLGIGTIILADGTRPKGFLVEPEGIAGAQDITAYGGWRAYRTG